MSGLPGGAGRHAGASPLVRVPRTAALVLSSEETGRLIAALRTAWDPAMVLAGLRGCEVLGLRGRRCPGRGPAAVHRRGQGRAPPGHPSRTGSCGRRATYLHDERPQAAAMDRLLVVVKGPRRGLPLSAEGLDEILSGARSRAGLDHASAMSCVIRA